MVLTSEQDMIEELEVRSPLANSDHSIIVFRLVWESVVVCSRMESFNYHKGNYGAVCRELREIDHGVKFHNKGVGSMWFILLEEVKLCRDRYMYR